MTTKTTTIRADELAIVKLPHIKGGGRAMVIEPRDGGLVPLYEGPIGGVGIVKRTRSGCAGYLKVASGVIRRQMAKGKGGNADWLLQWAFQEAVKAFVYPDPFAFEAQCLEVGTIPKPSEELAALCRTLWNEAEVYEPAVWLGSDDYSLTEEALSEEQRRLYAAIKLYAEWGEAAAA